MFSCVLLKGRRTDDIQPQYSHNASILVKPRPTLNFLWTQITLRGGFHRRQRTLILALAVGALRDPTGFEPFLDQVAGSTVGTLLGQRLAPSYEVALGITAATVDGLAPLRTPLHYFTLRAIGT